MHHVTMPKLELALEPYSVAIHKLETRTESKHIAVLRLAIWTTL